MGVLYQCGEIRMYFNILIYYSFFTFVVVVVVVVVVVFLSSFVFRPNNFGGA
jgi:hypothetical protein